MRRLVLGTLKAVRWADIKLGGPRTKCRWDGHDVEDSDAYIAYKRCGRCDLMVRVNP